jgi:hypothetical protein
VALLVALVLPACGGDEEPAVAAPTAPPPVVTVRSTCYGPCPYAGPVDVPDVAVYEDGTVIATSADGLTRTTVADDELTSLLRRAEAAGLTGGGVSVNGTTRGTADGSGTLFTARTGDVVTVLEAPFLGYLDEFAEPVDLEQRERLDALADALAGAAEGGEPVEDGRYARVDGEACEIVESPTRRPLLPHEADCDDVRRSRDELRLKELGALRR